MHAVAESSMLTTCSNELPMILLSRLRTELEETVAIEPLRVRVDGGVEHPVRENVQGCTFRNNGTVFQNNFLDGDTIYGN